jgi:hypothetical protein
MMEANEEVTINLISLLSDRFRRWANDTSAQTLLASHHYISRRGFFP